MDTGHAPPIGHTRLDAALRKFCFDNGSTLPFRAIDTGRHWNGFNVVHVPATERAALIAALDHGVRDWERRLVHADGTIIDPSGGSPLPLVTVDGICDDNGNAIGAYDLSGYCVIEYCEACDKEREERHVYVALLADMIHALKVDADQETIQDAAGLLESLLADARMAAIRDDDPDNDPAEAQAYAERARKALAAYEALS